MRGRRIISVVVLSSVMLIVSALFASGLVEVPLRNVFSPTAAIASPGPGTVFVDPRWYVKDYTLAPIGSTFTVHINITDVSDLFTWNVNLTWNPAILNFSKVQAYGTFLRATPSRNGTSGWIDRDPAKNVTIAPFNNTRGWASIAETILNSSANARGVSGSGRLVTIEFLVVGYGRTALTFGVSGILPTTLLNSTRASMAFTTTGGYFDNRIPGDITGPENPPGSGLYPYDRTVTGYDLIYLCKKFGTADPVADFTGPENPVGSGTYPPDGTVDGRDLIALCKNFGRTV